MPKKPRRKKPLLRHKTGEDYINHLLHRYHHLNPWGQRILDLRMCLGWSQRQFAHISGVNRITIRILERQYGSTYYPALVTIKKIRLLEAAYRLDLDRFKKDRRHYNRLHARHSTRRYLNPPIGPPNDPAFVQALGGVARFAVLNHPRRIWRGSFGRFLAKPRTDTRPPLSEADARRYQTRKRA